MPETSIAHHFSLSNPIDDGADDLPKLLRRLADTIQDLGIDPMNMLDLTIHEEVTADGPWWSGTFYWSMQDQPS